MITLVKQVTTFSECNRCEAGEELEQKTFVTECYSDREIT